MMRQVVILLVVGALSAFADGERTGLSASQQQKLFNKNRGMIQSLVDSSLEISNLSGDYIQRSRSYRQVVMQFQKELDQAAGDSDPSRVAEIGQHLDTVLRQGLAPSLRAAQKQIGPAGTGQQDLFDIRDGTIELVNWLQNKARNKWADTPEVREVVDSLQKTKKELATSVGP